SGSFDITVGSVAKFVFNPSPSNATAGAAFPTQPVVEAQDAGGNVVTSFNGTVTLTIANNPGGGTLSGTAGATAINGVATFSGLSINRSGTGYTLQASDGSASGTSAGFDILAGAPTQLVFTASPADTRAGVAFTNQPVVQARDALGNISTSFNGPVTLAITSGTGAPGAVLAGTASLNAVNGVASFSGLSINKLGMGYRLTASIAGPISVVSNAFNITATGLVFTLQPVTTPAGQTLLVIAEAQDGANNTDTNFNGPVSVAIKFGTGAPRATLGGTLTVNAVNGVANFTAAGLNITTAASGYVLIASTSGLAGAESQPFDIVGGPAAQLAFATSPGNTPASAPLTLVIEARDSYGNLATSFAGPVDLSIANNPGGGTLGGTTSKAFSGGIASFGAADGLNIDRLGVGYTLHALSGALTADSAAFNITASRLVFAARPGNTPVGSVFKQQPVVRAEDGFGTLDTTFTGSIALTIAPGTGASGATLNGTTVLVANGGVASFSQLSIDRVGTAYQLSAASAGLPSVTSNAFDITKAVLYAPLIRTPGYPDLVARFSLSTGTVEADKPVLVTVTITNQGNTPAGQFWVDFYINPTTPPTGANQPWDKSCGGRRCDEGIAWYVDQLLAPGQSITLTSTPGSYYAKNTAWNSSFNTGLLNLYLYVDSWNPGTPTGAVHESNEANNRFELHLPTTPASASARAVTAAPAADLPALPQRPVRPEQDR
ncbi:MAG TPA: CARDB domain-containing protein, partial [Roseiflexaceae bacterium]|nr:CARDB domain-containing protein [Roseiflexaceae bacterium]